MDRKGLFGFVVTAGLALFVGQGVASAQAQTAQVQKAANAASAAPDAQAGLGRQVTLSPADQLTQSDAFLGRMETSRATVSRQLESARSQRDVVKTLCLNDKLNQVDVAIRSAKERRGDLEAAANRRDADLSTHEFTILTVLRQRTEQLSAEANQCIGQEAGFIGESAVTSTIDPNLPEEDPSQYPTGQIIVQTPSCTSCYK
jgi:hypothetical protein